MFGRMSVDCEAHNGEKTGECQGVAEPEKNSDDGDRTLSPEILNFRFPGAVVMEHIPIAPLRICPSCEIRPLVAYRHWDLQIDAWYRNMPDKPHIKHY